MCRYTAFLGRTLSPASVRQYMNIIRIIHLDAALPNPLEMFHYHIQSILTGMKRSKGASQNYKHPLTPSHLIALRNKLQLNMAADAMFFAIVTTCFFGLLRIGNALPSSSPAEKSVIKAKDLKFTQKGTVLTICSSKTIQFNERIHSVVLPMLPSHPLCPVSALRNFISIAGLPSPTQPLFSIANQPAYTAQLFRKRLTSLVANIVDSPKDFSTHSLRRGGATWLLNAGAPFHLIKLLGDWKSDAVLKYLRPNVDDSHNVINSLASKSL